MSADSPAAVPLIHIALSLSLQEVFPVQYGTKFDTALQALTAGLVCKLEQLLPVPNLSQVCTGVFFSVDIDGQAKAKMDRVLSRGVL